MKLIIIAALDEAGIIGNKGKLPWHISEDLKRFKRLTTGHTVLMGRKTFESIGKPLANRRNVVISGSFTPPVGVEVFPTLDAALHALKQEEKVFVIGGGQLYAQTIGVADELHITYVEGAHEGDVRFPWTRAQVESKFMLVAEESAVGCTFVDYVRK